MSQIVKGSTALIALAIAALPGSLSAAGFIPLLGGYFEYEEILDYVTYEAVGGVSGSVTGTDPRVAELITASVTAVEGTAIGTASGYAETTAGIASAGTDGPTAPTAALFSDYVPVGNQSAAAVSGLAAVRYDIQLVKLHPDAPDIALPILFTSMLSGSFSSLSVAGSGVGYQQLNSAGGVENVDAGLFVQPGDTLRVEAMVSTGSDLGLISATAPVFAIDPAVQVSFIPNPDGSVRFVPATDLYTLIYPAAIGYAGSFNTVTPLTDGCLPDPSILAPSGLPSVTDGQAISCQALDPSGFRSYGPGVLDPQGVLNDLSIVITPDAIVRTDEPGTETIGILGSNNDLYNDRGAVRAAGDSAVAVYFSGGDGNTVSNYGEISSSGLDSSAIEIEGDDGGVYNTDTGSIATTEDRSTAIYIEGDSDRVLNEGTITTNGFRSSAVVVEGDEGELLNEGSVQTTGHQSSGLVFEGFFGLLDNEGVIGTQGEFAAGIVALGISSVHNAGQIVTNGDDAMGILALGPGHEVSNDGAGSNNQIYTLGARAHGIALGLQDAVIPPGVGIPPEALEPASGTIRTSGPVTTEGSAADAVHALANDLELTNTGELTTMGADAFGISVEGDAAAIQHGDTVNPGSIETRGDRAGGIDVIGNNARVTIDGGVTASTILTRGGDANGVNVLGSDAVVRTKGTITVEGVGSVGIDVFGDGAEVENSGTILAGLNAESTNNRGLNVNSRRGLTKNYGTIQVHGSNAYGILALDDDIAVTNGDTANRGASIEVSGAGGTGMYVESNAPAVINEGSIRVSGDQAAGIHVISGVGSVSQVTSAGTIDVSGPGAVGMRLSSSPAWGTGTASGLAPACAVINDSTSKFVNCGSIDFADSIIGEGMFAENVANTTIENQGRIEGEGTGARGIRVTSGPAVTSGGRNNLIANVDSIVIGGAGAVGVEVTGDNNVVIQGNGLIRLPSDPFADPLDIQDVFGSELYPNAPEFANEFTRDTPAGVILPVARILVVGDGSVGLSINGNGNRIGQVFSGQASNTLIEAQGANSVGVKLDGDGNLFVNGGQIIAQGVGIRGGAGADSVTNQNTVEGGIDLAGGSDRLVVDLASEIIGTADGGEDRDELIFFVSPGERKVIDGNQYINFEDLWKLGAGELLVTNTLRGDDLLLEVGELELAPGARLETSASSIHVRNDGRLSGSGTAEGTLLVEGGTLAPGAGIGLLSVEGDLLLDDGVLAFEAESPLATDSLLVSGDVTFAAGVVEVYLGYTPDPGDVLTLLTIAGTLNVLPDFGGVMGIAMAGSGVALGSQFVVELGGQLFQGTVTSMVPVPPALYLFCAGMIGIIGIARRRKAA